MYLNQQQGLRRSEQFLKVQKWTLYLTTPDSDPNFLMILWKETSV